jgi:hypothetical protein
MQPLMAENGNPHTRWFCKKTMLNNSNIKSKIVWKNGKFGHRKLCLVRSAQKEL